MATLLAIVHKLEHTTYIPLGFDEQYKPLFGGRFARSYPSRYTVKDPTKLETMTIKVYRVLDGKYVTDECWKYAIYVLDVPISIYMMGKREASKHFRDLEVKTKGSKLARLFKKTTEQSAELNSELSTNKYACDTTFKRFTEDDTCVTLRKFCETRGQRAKLVSGCEDHWMARRNPVASTTTVIRHYERPNFTT